MREKSKDKAWQKIFAEHRLHEFDFDESFFEITAGEIKRITNSREPRVLCNFDAAEDRPKLLKDLRLFLLPIKNGTYCLLRGEGYHYTEEIEGAPVEYRAKLPFDVLSLQERESESEHLDYSYLSSLLRTFFQEDSIVLSIRGRKQTDRFQVSVGNHRLDVKGVQFEVDSGFEGTDSLFLIEGKAKFQNNFLIRQLYYPYRHWKLRVEDKKKVHPVFFYNDKGIYKIWQYEFTKLEDYNSIKLVKSGQFKIVQ